MSVTLRNAIQSQLHPAGYVPFMEYARRGRYKGLIPIEQCWGTRGLGCETTKAKGQCLASEGA